MLRQITIFSCASLLAACAHRTPAPQTTIAWEGAAITRYADANRDGKVTRKEAEADPNLVRRFARYDTNDDGVLDRGEFAQLEEESRRETTTATAAARVERERAPRLAPVTLNRTGDPGHPERE